ncbi:uncharacterized protein LOC135495125 [Lineus longissimus]|uniref:uncharacterized protein LOC135495125 n=1 Tax=Lineus longissimus TaxID=88925 RepID=UPI002B4C36D5
MMAPTLLVLVNAIFFSLVGSLLWIICITTDGWDMVTYRRSVLQNSLTAANKSTQVFVLSHYGEEGRGYSEIKTTRYNSAGNLTSIEYKYAFDSYGGMWKTCDYLTASQRLVLRENRTSWHSKGECFHYLTEYQELMNSLKNEAKWLVRMQNSAVSCIIVVNLLIACSVMTTIYGLWHKQVAVCMVTSAMYVIAAVFCMFGLSIIHAKNSYMMEPDCYSLVYHDPITKLICPSKVVWQGWSIVIGWVAMSFFLLSFFFWSFLCRWMRQENSKHFAA